MAQENKEAPQGQLEAGSSGMTTDLEIRSVCLSHPCEVLSNTCPSHTRREGALG